MLSKLRAITVSVDYGDLLEVTVPWNRHHFSEMCVVTSPDDVRTQTVCEGNDISCFITDSFYADNAVFNKWIALEEGLDYFGRHGVLTILDADVLWPGDLNTEFEFGYLYSPYRHVLRDVTKFRYDLDWSTVPLKKDTEFSGYSQIFHVSDPHLGSAPWHETNWKHAGGADSFFQMKWPNTHKRRPNFQVLHLGEDGKNWCGRTTPYIDGTVPVNADDRRRQLNEFIESRRWTKNFDLEKI